MGQGSSLPEWLTPTALSHYHSCFFFFFLFRATPTAYGSSQGRSRIGAVAAGLHHSHSVGSELHL